MIVVLFFTLFSIMRFYFRIRIYALRFLFRFEQHVISIVKPPVVNVIDFLLAHLQHDIGCLARSSGKNENEAIQIIHLVLTGIINQQLQKQPG